MKIILKDAAGEIIKTLETHKALWYVPPNVVHYKGEYYARTSADDHPDPEFNLVTGRTLNDTDDGLKTTG